MEKQERICPKHGLVIHYWAVERATGYGRWRCRRCGGEAVLKRKRRVRNILLTEGGGCCQSCGYSRLKANLHFHHVDPSQKSFALCSGNGKSLARFREEARKCVLVCANCHGEIEAGIRKCPPRMADRVAVFNMKPLTLKNVAAYVRQQRAITGS